MASRHPHYLTPTKASMANSVRKNKGQEILAVPSSTIKTPRRAAQQHQPSTTNNDATTTPVSKRTTRKTPASSRRSLSQKKQPHRTTAAAAAPKRLYLIRHGESMGQAAKRLGMDRKRDPRLRDAALTKEGRWQAQQLTEYEFEETPELIVSSPLTRALHTAILGFPSHRSNILIHYDLAELGSRAPENTPRPIQHVLNDLMTDRVDYMSLLPATWPAVLYDGNNNRTKAIRRAMQYLFEEREEEIIAVVCHFNVIRQIVDDGGSLRPQNALPIHCELRPNGQVVQIDEEARKQLDFG